ncbi:MAG: restriction endonuclease subunit S, partial [Thermodesulfobacteriota bacterium]
MPRSGSVALNHRAVLGVDAYMVSHICALEVVDERKIHNLYAYYYLRSIKMDRISKKTTGLDAITFEDLGKIKIPLPPLDDQIRIAHLLSKVEGLIARRKQHLQQLDALLKSIFLELFGDPVRNEKGWESSSIDGLCVDIIDCPHSTPIYSDEKTNYLCVRSSDIIDGYLDLGGTYQVD